MRDVVVVFARTPRLGTVKRRLARSVGARAALQFHRAMLSRLVRAVRRERRFDTVFALTGGATRWPRGVARIRQERGDLGRRMEHAFRRFPRRRVVLVGTDIPALGAADLRAAFRALGRTTAVFGPAEDGGFWLAGFGPRRPARPFAGVRWSSRHTLADTLANLRPRPVALLRRLRDVDTAADLRAAREAGLC